MNLNIWLILTADPTRRKHLKEKKDLRTARTILGWQSGLKLIRPCRSSSLSPYLFMIRAGRDTGSTVDPECERGEETKRIM